MDTQGVLIRPEDRFRRHVRLFGGPVAAQIPQVVSKLVHETREVFVRSGSTCWGAKVNIATFYQRDPSLEDLNGAYAEVLCSEFEHSTGEQVKINFEQADDGTTIIHVHVLSSCKLPKHEEQSTNPV